MTCRPTIRTICLHMYARPIAGAFSSLPSTFRLLNLLIFTNFLNIMIPLDFGYLNNLKPVSVAAWQFNFRHSRLERYSWWGRRSQPSWPAGYWKNTWTTSLMFARPHLISSGVQSIYDAEKVSARQVFKVTLGKYERLKIRSELV